MLPGLICVFVCVDGCVDMFVCVWCVFVALWVCVFVVHVYAGVGINKFVVNYAAQNGKWQFIILRKNKYNIFFTDIFARF